MPVELFYREKGRRENPPLILLHGLWGASDNWLPVAETLAGRFRVILPDLRNHGQSPRHPEHTYAALGEDVEALIHRLALSSPPFMAGHSMGGKCLMYLLLKTPEIARKAAVIDISPKTYDTPGEGLHRKLLDFSPASHSYPEKSAPPSTKEYAGKSETSKPAKLYLKTSSGIPPASTGASIRTHLAATWRN